MKYGWLIVAIFAARFLVVAVAYLQADGDLSWQRWLGGQIARTGAIPQTLGWETFTAPGAHWVPQEWLFALAAHAGREGLGWDLFSGAVALCAIVALALSAMRAEARGASPKAIALCSAFAGIALFESFGVRAQVVAWPLLVAYLALFDREDRFAWFAVLVAAAWSNLHASAALAPALAFAMTLGALVDDRALTRRVVRKAGIAFASLVAICCNPFGYHLPEYAVTLLRSPIKANILEWKATGLDDASFLYGAFALVLIALAVGSIHRPGARKVQTADAMLFAIFLALMFSAARNIAIFALVALPAVAAALTDRVPWFRAAPVSHDRAERIARIALPSFAILVAIVVAVGLLRAQPRSNDALARSALAALEREPGEHRVLCNDFAYCGLLVGVKGQRVFLDGRADPYPKAVWDDFVEIVRLRPAWRATLDERGVNAVVADKGLPLDEALAQTPGWRSAFGDSHYRLWLRDRFAVRSFERGI
ncbi:MAG: hypothetical protein GIW95_12665 [Candidatus Eremiobacteraeota bacterium]|nr:hypothetical protein [Candidatus Eremiobacteraeota bacterium]